MDKKRERTTRGKEMKRSLVKSVKMELGGWCKCEGEMKHMKVILGKFEVMKEGLERQRGGSGGLGGWRDGCGRRSCGGDVEL